MGGLEHRFRVLKVLLVAVMRTVKLRVPLRLLTVIGLRSLLSVER